MSANPTSPTPPPEFGELVCGTARLRTARWRATVARPRGTIVLLHGRTEFNEKYSEVAGELLARGFAVWTMDWRGQGLSTRPFANRSKGFIDRFETYLADLDAFVELVRQSDAALPRYVVAHSMGAHVTLRYVHDRPRAFEKAVLSAPMVDIAPPGGRVGHALARALAGLMVACGRGGDYAPGAPGGGDYRAEPFEGNVLTNDEARYAAQRDAIRACPELALGGPTYGWLHAAFRSVARLREAGYGRGIKTPVLLCSAADETVVSNAAQRELCAYLPSVRLVSLAGAKHEILQEIDAVRAEFWRAFDAFVP